MPKFDLKKAFGQVTKLADDTIGKVDVGGIAKQVQNIDVNAVLKSGGKMVGDVANSIRHADPMAIKDDVIHKVVEGGNAIGHYVTDSIDTTKDANRAIKMMKKTNEDTQYLNMSDALQLVYYLMAVDNTIDDKEMAVFDSIYQDSGISKEKYEEIVEACNQTIEAIREDEDYEELVIEKMVELAHHPVSEDKRMLKKQLLWNLLTLAKSDEAYSESEKHALRTLSRHLELDKAIISEMEMSYDTLVYLHDHNESERYQYIQKSVMQLIQDKEA